MLKKMNQIRRNLSKGSADKKKEADSSAKKKKSNQKKVNQETQTDTAQKNASKRLDFDGLRGRHLKLKKFMKKFRKIGGCYKKTLCLFEWPMRYLLSN